MIRRSALGSCSHDWDKRVMAWLEGLRSVAVSGVVEGQFVLWSESKRQLI
jgi:hypothetical protein